jgi:hypothetical protein
MMKYLLLALAVTAVSAQFDEADVDALLAEDVSLPCTPKPCVPVCKPVTKYITYGSFKISYTENECKPDVNCLAAHAACLRKLQDAMKTAAAKAAALDAASKAKNKAGANKAAKDKAAAARKAEAAAAKSALDAAKQAAVAAEKEAATARATYAKLAASTAAAKKESDTKTKIMDARVAAYEKSHQVHLNANAAYEGAKSEAAKAASDYAATVKRHCDAEAQHATAVKTIGHGHLAKNTCQKFEWSGRKNGTYLHEQHGRTNECYDFATAKSKCEKAADCHAIATQSNVCGGKYRVTHGGPTLRHYNNWKPYNLWAYTLKRK